MTWAPDSGALALARSAQTTARRSAFDKEGSGNVSKNRCEKNQQVGIHVADLGTRVILLENVCWSNGLHGIHFARGAGGMADGNECKGNQGFGILASNSGTRPTFRRNRVTDNAGGGIGKEQGAAPVIQDNNVESGNGE